MQGTSLRESPPYAGASLRKSPPYAGGLSAQRTGGSVRRTEHKTESAPTPAARSGAPLHRGAI